MDEVGDIAAGQKPTRQRVAGAAGAEQQKQPDPGEAVEAAETSIGRDL